MARIDLPDGAWAELRDPKQVSTAQRRLYQRAMRRLSPESINRLSAINERRIVAEKAGDEEALQLANLELNSVYASLPEAEVDAIDAASDAASAALVAAWSFDKPITVESVVNLPASVGDALREATGPLVARMFLDTSPDPNPSAPSRGSDDSATPSPEEPSTTSPTRSETSVSSA